MLRKIFSWYKRFQISKSPQLNLVWGFFLYTMLGLGLLSIPLFHKVPVSFIDNLFISTSAISTTGLATISVSDSYNFFGQAVVLLLIQIGGIGYMTLTSYYLLLTTRKLNPFHNKVLGAEFTLPTSIKLIDFIRSAILFTFIMEALGAILLYIEFKAEGMKIGEAAWFAIFHSVSAFCTAGFGLLNDSFMQYRDNALINIVIAVLSIAGSLGFFVVTDIWYRITKKASKLSFTTRLIVVGFFLLLFGGTILIYFSEPHIRGFDNAALMTAFFQAMTAMTTVGFNTIDTGMVSLPVLLLVVFLMYVGASPSGTGGGMKITTLIAMIAVLKSRVFGQKKITFMKRVIPFERLYVATSTFILYTILIFFFTWLLSYTEEATFSQILFEVSSALGTVGLSMGITGGLTEIGKVFIVILMFIGRVGVLTFGFALLARNRRNEPEFLEDDLAV